MQIAGNTCTICGGRIVFADEGKFCLKCQTVAHLACCSEPRCPVCSGPFTEYQRPKADPDSVRFNSQAERNFGPAAAVLFVVFGLVIVLWLVFWESARRQG